MSKIKLSILLLVSLLLISCSSHNTYNTSKYKFKMDYIGGGYDGLVLKRLLQSNLKAFNFYNDDSNMTIKANISHNIELYITNIDNTSDREKITSNVDINIYHVDLKCNILNFNRNISQFYIYASNEKFLSNDRAVESIKYNNTEELVKNFINSLNNFEVSCNE